VFVNQLNIYEVLSGGSATTRDLVGSCFQHRKQCFTVILNFIYFEKENYKFCRGNTVSS